MKWFALLICVVSALAGCCGTSSNSPTDPFYGYTRVPPPGTGSINAQSADPYYPGAPNSTGPTSGQPGSMAPNTAAPNTLPRNPGTITPVNPGTNGTGTNRYAPPGNSFNYQGRTGSPGRGSATCVPAPSYARRQATSARVPRLADRRTRPAERSAVPRGRAVDIMDLPDAKSSTSPDRAATESNSSGFRLVSAEKDPSEPSQVIAAAATSESHNRSTVQGNYGHDSEYRRLRGKIEHSQVDGCWKLRYIPIDGATDEFGGSVVLPDESVLKGFERGDFAEVRGKIGPRDEPAHGFSPTYEVDEIVRIAH